MTEPDSAADALFRRWCRQGDAAALGELFDATAPRLLALAIHLVGDAAEAEDLVQATFLTAIERRAEVDPARPVLPWLTGVLAHKARQHRRRAARAPDPGRLAAQAVEDPSRPLERRELDGELARALDALEEPYRAVLVLRLRHGLGAADIAHVLQRDPGTVRVQLHRGLERLRALLPAALATTLALGILAPRGLAAVKVAVLDGAVAAAGASSSLVVGSLLMSKKVLVGAVLAVLVALVWWQAPSRTARSAPDEPAGARSALAALGAVPSDAVVPAGVEPSRTISWRESATPDVAGPVLCGRVVDAESGAPIAGASLRLFAPRATSAFALLREHPDLYQAEVNGRIRARTSGDWPLVVAGSVAARFGAEPLLAFDRPAAGEEPLERAQTDAEGRFALAFPDGGGVLEGASPGHATRWRAVRAPDEAYTLELWREREVHGVVLGPDGEPLREPLELALCAERTRARQEPEAVDPTLPLRFVATAIHESPFGDLDAANEALGAWRMRSDESGRFHARIGATSVAVSVLSPGWGLRQWSHHELDGQELQVWVVRPPGFLVLDAVTRAPVERVRLLGTELANRYVRWAGEFHAPGGWLAIPGDWSYVHSPQGALAFVLWSEGYAPARVAIADIEATGTIEVPLERGAAEELRGSVTRGSEPLAGVEVALLGHSPLQWSEDADEFVDATRTDAEGRFRLTAPAGTYLLRVRADEGPFLEKLTRADRPNSWMTQAIAGHEPFLRVVELPAPGGLALELQSAAAIEVEIVDKRGAPRVEHPVALRDDADGRQGWRYTDADGRVRFAGLPASRYRLHTPDVATFGSFAGGQQREVELGAGAVERVRIELPTHDGPRHARVLARDTASYLGWRARYDHGEWVELEADGTVPLDLTTDRWEFEVAAADGRRWHRSIPKDAPDGTVIELDEGAGRYRGVLRHADGSAWPGVDVHAIPWGPGASPMRVACTTDERGEFELGGLGAGPYRLRFQTCLERGVWDEWENELAGVSFSPGAPPTPEGTWLALQGPEPAGEVRLGGHVVDGSGGPVALAQLFFEGESPVADGAFLRSGRASSVHTDEAGAFELVLPAAERFTVRVYLGQPSRRLALTHVFGPGEGQRLRLVLP
ncbi:MAG TPA: sigma-70 family RNA polymerase sigma factor [Planctomycetota bacterium]